MSPAQAEGTELWGRTPHCSASQQETSAPLLQEMTFSSSSSLTSLTSKLYPRSFLTPSALGEHNYLQRCLEILKAWVLAGTSVPGPPQQPQARSDLLLGMLAPHTTLLQTCGEEAGCRTHKLFLCRKEMKTKQKNLTTHSQAHQETTRKKQKKEIPQEDSKVCATSLIHTDSRRSCRCRAALKTTCF